MRTLRLFLLAMVICIPAAAEPSAEGYQRCSACHLAAGEGIPGAFPPLKNRVAKIASTAQGRAYLVSVVNVGLMGSITVDGTPYMGVMPAQGALYDAQGISEVLNYSVQVIDESNVAEDWVPYTAAEVESLLAEGGARNGQESLKLRNALLEQRPELQ
jgi:hypothetical protein